MGKSHSKNNELLVYGYVRRHETKYEWPSSLSSLVLSFYPDCNVYGIGRNGLCEFGLGDYRKLTRFELLQHMTAYCDDPKDIYLGDHRFVTKNIHGKLYSAGKNTNGDTGISGPDMLKSMERIKGIEPTDTSQFITVISSGISARHTFVVFNDNTIHAYGWNQFRFFLHFLSNTVYTNMNYRFGQFGNGRQNAYAKLSKVRLNNLWRIKEIACGATHSLFLTSDGSVYCAGKNDMGQCGIEMSGNFNMNCILQMVPIPDLFNILSVACGSSHSLCLNKDGKVFVFGLNDYGQCGFAHPNLDQTVIPKPILQETLDANESKIGIIRCGAMNSLFIDVEKQEAYLCGDNLHGQIGNNQKDESMTALPCLFKYHKYKIVDGSCGIKHTVLMTDQRNVLLAFGSNDYFQCTSSKRQKYIFKPYVLTADEIGIKNKKETIVRALCGADTTIVTTRGV